MFLPSLVDHKNCETHMYIFYVLMSNEVVFSCLQSPKFKKDSPLHRNCDEVLNIDKIKN